LINLEKLRVSNYMLYEAIFDHISMNLEIISEELEDAIEANKEERAKYLEENAEMIKQ